MRIRRYLLLGAVLGYGSGLLSATPATAAIGPPQWEVVAVSSPTNLLPTMPRNEVQEVDVHAEGGTFDLNLTTRYLEGVEKVGPLPYNASAAEVEAAINAQSQDLEGTVSVSGGGSQPYVVTFEGGEGRIRLGEGPVPMITTAGSSLTGVGASISVREVTKGARPAAFLVTATNVGGATDGSTIAVEDALPAGVSVTKVVGYDAYRSVLVAPEEGTIFGNIFGEEASLTCASPPAVSCTYSGKVDTGDSLNVVVEAHVDASVGSLANRAVVSGGGAPEATQEEPFTVSETPAAFGPVPGSTFVASSTDQAGAHADVTTAFTLSSDETWRVADDPKDVRFDLPQGLVGNTVGLPTCTMAEVTQQRPFSGAEPCPRDSMVGMATIYLIKNVVVSFTTPVYNIAPAPGEPAAFGFLAEIVPVRLDTTILSNGDYGVRVTAPDLSQEAPVLGTSVTIWGVPADHNGLGEKEGLDLFGQHFGGPEAHEQRVPLLTNPQQCTEPLSATMSTDSWAEAGKFENETASMGTLTGCNLLNLESSFSMLPDTLEAGAPAGYAFHLNVPQSTDPDGLATPNVKSVKLTLPVGTVISPSAAWGLKACSDAQFYGPGRGTQSPATPAACPREAQVGTVSIKTPALEEQLTGEVYLAEPSCNPCTPQDAEDGRMVRLFVQVVSEGEGGIVVKLEGKGMINQQTGQITTVFEGDPQLPFSDFKLTLGGGPRATLANPRTCGPATTSMDIAPWTSPFGPDSLPSYTFDVSENCFGPQFGPSFVAGTTNIQAGEYTPFTLSFGRSDNDEMLGGLSLTMPPGLLGNIGSVALCKEPEASQGTCPAASAIGHVQALTGPGADPFLVSGGQVFLTESYGGAPYGLSIVVPAVAGPYTLSGTTGHGTVVVRAKIQVDPTDAHLTVTSDPLPTMLDGIPLQLKGVQVTIDHPGFTFNPTSCSESSITGSLSSAEGGSATVSSPFQVTNCASLSFKPKFSVSTAGHTSRRDGASLDVKLTYPDAGVGGQANIRSVKVDLPKQLPSRLTTLQKACTDSTFDLNPAACPAASRVGFATATTPIIPVPLSGPAYFVSHGGAKFPELIIALSGYGVTVYLHGETFISKAGITSSTFPQVPDVPIGNFELTLPEGPNSALAANGNLCESQLRMPTAFVAQNGMAIHQATKISVTGCKPAIEVLSRKVRGSTATIRVSVPSPGKLAVSGSELSRPRTVSVGDTGTATVTFTLSKRERLVIADHPGRRLEVRVKLLFTPARGNMLSGGLTVLMG